MRPVPVGARVKVIESGPMDDTPVGNELVVHMVDSDGTFRGRDPRSGRICGWLRWSQVEAVDQIGIEFLKGQLSAETVRLLLAFNGTENLRLKEEVRDRILLGLPDLGRLVRDEADRLGSAAPKLRKRRPRADPARAHDEVAEDDALAALGDSMNDSEEEV